MTKEIFLVVAYDIGSDRRRNALVKLLKDYGQRVNFSVFECRIKKQAFPKLKSEISKIISRKEDSVLFYDLCLDCERKREALGVKIFESREPVISI